MIATVPVTGSTNDDLLLAAHAGAAEGSWLRAERQEQGKGRLGRVWLSPAGNLSASTIVRLQPHDPAAATLALVAAVALEEVASAYAGAGRLQLKWPNDLMAGGAKLAGILLERTEDAVVIGFGVNLLAHPDAIDRPTTSLRELGHGAPEPAAFLGELAVTIARWLARWRTEGMSPVRDRWLARAHPLGTALAVAGAEGAIEGLFDGLELDGTLRLRRSDGTLALIHAGDVRLI